jgi:hypothetical protein
MKGYLLDTNMLIALFWPTPPFCGRRRRGV